MIPIRLIRLHNRLGSFRAVARARSAATGIRVNVKYVYALLVDGKEPTNKDIRHALYLPRTNRKRRAASRGELPQPSHRQWWTRLSVTQRDTCIWHEWKIFQDEEKRNGNKEV
jgi:hypothetical protein